MNTLLIQHDIVWEDKSANRATVDRLLDRANPHAGTLVVLPELFDTGFSMNLDRIVDGTTLEWAALTCRRRRLRVVAGWAERHADGRGLNCASVHGLDGATLGIYRKMHPFSFGREAEYYVGGDRIVLAEVDGVVVCPLICYDLRFPELWRLAALAGAEVFVIGANWPAARQAHWRALVIARAIENQAYVVAVNRVGTDPKIEYVGGSIVVDPRGTVVAEAGASTEALDATLDIPALRAWRREFPALVDARRALLGSCTIDRQVEINASEGESAPRR